MAPVSQELEPPANPGRFTIAFGSGVVVIPLSIATVVLSAFLAIDTWNGHGNPWTPFMVAIAPLVVVTPIVAVVTVVIGLPVHLAVRGTRYATRLGYSLTGGAVGLAFPVLPFILDGTYESIWMAPLGLVADTATGHAWWKARASLSNR